MILDILETITNYIITLDEKDRKVVLEKQRPGLVTMFSNDGCSDNFSSEIVNLMIQSVLSEKIDISERLKSLVDSMLDSAEELTNYDLCVLLKDLDGDAILNILDTRFSDSKIHRAAEILENTASTISLPKLKSLLSVTNLKTLISSMTNPNQFMEALHYNSSLNTSDKDSLVFDPFFGPKPLITKFGLLSIPEEDEDYETCGSSTDNSSPTTVSLSGKDSPNTDAE